ncbi:Cd(II)/Pb(II)-responsive transcriptional regulator (plasmid) [Maricurvus nonylphenolicus]|uniref:Cd(II)/Pb(II)-responsive transcriptional regulator n=1 Tax=Maricurvus nonylphenolicus TaxID=1008307 RepID=UPI0036F1DA33
MQIGELAKLTGCSVQTIRYYEKQNLLESTARSEGNFRLYDASAVEQLMFIKHCRSLDLALSEVRQLIELNQSPDMHCDDVNSMIDNHIEQVEQRMTELERLRQHLTSLRDSCSTNRTVEECGILKNLSAKQLENP